MKKLIAAIMVSFMMLSLMTGCGAEKSFDGDILDVVSFDMSKTEILKNAEKEFGEISSMETNGKTVLNYPEDAEIIVYSLDSVYGYEGDIVFSFESDLCTLRKVEILYLVEDGNIVKQYKDIVNQFIDMYGPGIWDTEEMYYMTYKGKTRIALNYFNDSSIIKIFFGAEENWDDYFDAMNS